MARNVARNRRPVAGVGRPMDAYSRSVRADFDRIAQLGGDAWNHNLHYHAFLLRQVPTPCRRALDVGCETGGFTERLSEQMIAGARMRLPDPARVSLEIGDVLTHPLPRDHHDYVVSLTTLHHLPLDVALGLLARTVAPGGVLAVLDIPAETSLPDHAIAALAAPVKLLLMRRHLGRWRRDPEVLAAWLEHGRTDVYTPLGEVREVCRAVLPGAVVRRHLLWRYSIVWRKP